MWSRAQRLCGAMTSRFLFFLFFFLSASPSFTDPQRFFQLSNHPFTNFSWRFFFNSSIIETFFHRSIVIPFCFFFVCQGSHGVVQLPIHCYFNHLLVSTACFSLLQSFTSYNYSQRHLTSYPTAMSSRSPSRPSLSNASSMIFERSVQDIHSDDLVHLSASIPLHHSNEDFIPPVLSASCEALTQKRLDPEAVQVLTFRHSRRPSSARSPSFSDSLHLAAVSASSPTTEATSPPPLPPQTLSPNARAKLDHYFELGGSRPQSPGDTTTSSNRPARLAPSRSVLSFNMPAGPTARRSSSASSPRYLPLHAPLTTASSTTSGSTNFYPEPSGSEVDKRGRLLSFCSFADLVNSELPATAPPPPPAAVAGHHACCGSPTTMSWTDNGNGAASPSRVGSFLASQPLQTPMPQPSSPSMSETCSSEVPGEQQQEQQRLDEEDEDIVDIMSLGETLRRSTGIMTIIH